MRLRGQGGKEEREGEREGGREGGEQCSNNAPALILVGYRTI